VKTAALKSLSFSVCTFMLRCCKDFNELTLDRFHAFVRNECEHVLQWHAHLHTHIHDAHTYTHTVWSTRNNYNYTYYYEIDSEIWILHHN
jgi:hypothetical protein